MRGRTASLPALVLVLALTGCSQGGGGGGFLTGPAQPTGATGTGSGPSPAQVPSSPGRATGTGTGTAAPGATGVPGTASPTPTALEPGDGFTVPGTAPDSTAAAGATVPPVRAAAGTPGLPWAVVRSGRFAREPAVAVFTRYITARARAYATGSARVPGLAATATPRLLDADTAWITYLRRSRLTVPRPARWAVLGVTRRGRTAVLATCTWGPSTFFVGAAPGVRDEAVQQRWYGYDYVLVAAPGGGWRVETRTPSTNTCLGAT